VPALWPSIALSGSLADELSIFSLVLIGEGDEDMHKARTQRSIASRRVIEFPHQANERALYEDHIKARLQELTDFVDGFTNSTLNLVRLEKPSVREAMEELAVKEVALRWIVRVATLSTGTIRDRLWVDIDKALSDLEVIAESLKHARVEWSAHDPAGARDQVICFNTF
jgi:hypothetical protein